MFIIIRQSKIVQAIDSLKRNFKELKIMQVKQKLPEFLAEIFL